MTEALVIRCMRPVAVTRARRGMALLNVLLLMSVFTAMMVTGINMLQNARGNANEVNYDTQAYSVARAGISDALNWFRRQSTQPVASFAPVEDPVVNEAGDTWDPYRIDPGGTGASTPNLGIVREYELNGPAGLWARYEVGKITRLRRDSQGKLRNYVLMEQAGTGVVPVQVASASVNAYEGVQDVSDSQGIDTDGTVWRIRSHGYIYKKAPTATTGTWFFQFPHEVLGQADVETEIRRLKVKDYGGILISSRGDRVTISQRDKIKFYLNSGYGVRYPAVTTGNPSPATFDAGSGGNEIDWNGASASSAYNAMATPFTLDTNEAFGVPSLGILSLIADVRATGPSQLQPSASGLIYLKPSGGTAVFNSSNPLKGDGALVVDGNLTIEAGSRSLFKGTIYVTGNFLMKKKSEIIGQIIVLGTTNIYRETGGGGDEVRLRYDQTEIQNQSRPLEQYREIKSAQRATQ